MRIAPKEVMAAVSPVYRTGKGSRRLAIAGLLCVLTVVPLAGLPGYRGIPLPGYLATLLLFLGFALIALLLLSPVVFKLTREFFDSNGASEESAAGTAD